MPNSQDGTHKALALRGYVRLAGQSDNPTATYIRAMELATRPEDKKLVLAELGTADSALALVQSYLGNGELRAEAALAVVQIAGRLRQTEPTRAKAALKNVVSIVVSLSDQDVGLELDSELVHGKNTSRGIAPRQDVVDAKLNKGPNDLKLKVIDNEGGWAFACRVRKLNGSTPDGLRIEAK